MQQIKLFSNIGLQQLEREVNQFLKDVDSSKMYIVKINHTVAVHRFGESYSVMVILSDFKAKHNFKLYKKQVKTDA